MSHTVCLLHTGQDTPSCTVKTTWHYGRAPLLSLYRTQLAQNAVEGFWLAGVFVAWRPFKLLVGAMLAIYSPAVIPVLLLLRSVLGTVTQARASPATVMLPVRLVSLQAANLWCHHLTPSRRGIERYWHMMRKVLRPQPHASRLPRASAVAV